MKILLAFDSFKGSLSAQEAVSAANYAIKKLFPLIKTIELPLADGGDGTVQVLSHYLLGNSIFVKTHDPLMRPITSKYFISKDKTTAIIEMAAAAGLLLLSTTERNPMETTTFGVGELLLDAIHQGVRRIFIGLGGSSTNDGGMGFLSALGYRFLDSSGKQLYGCGKNLSKIVSILPPIITQYSGVDIEAICDVTNPLYGTNGSAHVYSMQKGATLDMITKLDKGLCHYSKLIGVDPFIKGSGAAGGLGYALNFIKSNLRNGTDIVFEISNFDTNLLNADLVITGEGCIDSQTLSGKLPFGVLSKARKQGIPVIALAGKVKDKQKLLEAGFDSVYQITPQEQTLSEAMLPATAKKNIYTTIQVCLSEYFNNRLLL